jgi:hypothetical protein
MIQSLETFWLQQAYTENHYDNSAAHERQGQCYKDSPDGAAGHSDLFYTSLRNTYVGNINRNYQIANYEGLLLPIWGRARDREFLAFWRGY